MYKQDKDKFNIKVTLKIAAVVLIIATAYAIFEYIQDASKPPAVTTEQMKILRRVPLPLAKLTPGRYFAYGDTGLSYVQIENDVCTLPAKENEQTVPKYISVWDVPEFGQVVALSDTLPPADNIYNLTSGTYKLYPLINAYTFVIDGVPYKFISDGYISSLGTVRLQMPVIMGGVDLMTATEVTPDPSKYITSLSPIKITPPPEEAKSQYLSTQRVTDTTVSEPAETTVQNTAATAATTATTTIQTTEVQS
jgi:hypothetical protein